VHLYAYIYRIYVYIHTIVYVYFTCMLLNGIFPLAQIIRMMILFLFYHKNSKRTSHRFEKMSQLYIHVNKWSPI
jgi:hypothetical protein